MAVQVKRCAVIPIHQSHIPITLPRRTVNASKALPVLVRSMKSIYKLHTDHPSTFLLLLLLKRCSTPQPCSPRRPSSAYPGPTARCAAPRRRSAGRAWARRSPRPGPRAGIPARCMGRRRCLCPRWMLRRLDESISLRVPCFGGKMVKRTPFHAH